MMIENFTIKCDFHLAVAQSQCHLTCLFVFACNKISVADEYDIKKKEVLHSG